jgi:hypothetical protein
MCGWLVWFEDKKTKKGWNSRAHGLSIDDADYLQTYYGRCYERIGRLLLIRGSSGERRGRRIILQAIKLEEGFIAGEVAQ